MVMACGARGDDPSLTWHTFTTAHFHVHFHDDGEAFARRTAAIAEEARATLTKDLDWFPANDRVHVICHDLADGSNGFARMQPFSAMTIQAFGPEADTDLARYDDWLRVLVYHELLHILHLDQVSGVPSWFNVVLGKTLLPNLALPGWFIEGLATWGESTYTPRGRVGSAQFEMYLRSALLGGTLPDHIGGLTGDPLERPGGTWAYAFGSAFMTWVIDRHGRDKLADFVARYGNRILPYGMNNVARLAFGGEDWIQLFAGWRTDFAEKVQLQVAALRQQGLMTGRQLTTSGHVHHAPIWAPDGRSFAVVESDGYDLTFMTWVRLNGDRLDKTRLYPCHGGCGRAVFAPDSGTLYSIGRRWSDPYRMHRDVVAYDLQTRPRQPVRITRGLRARELAISPDGRKLVFVTAHWGQTALVEHDLRSGKQTTRVPHARGLQLNQPRYLPDGSLVFSAQASGGWRDLWRLEGQRLERLTHTPDREISLSVSPDGGTLYFSSDHGGIWNIHALHRASGTQKQVTRVLGGAFNPSVSPDGSRLLYASYSAAGFDLFLRSLNPDDWAAVATSKGPPEQDYQPTPAAGELRDYSAWRSVWPRAWSPQVQFDQTGFTSAGVELSGNDAVGNHFWLLAANYTQTNQDVGLSLSYSYTALRPTFSFSFSRSPSSGFRFVADEWTDHHRENLFGSFGTHLAFPHIKNWVNLRFGLNWLHSFEPNPPDKILHDPGENEPFLPKERHHEVGINVGWSYEATEQYHFSISPDEGWRVGSTFTLVPTWLGNGSLVWSLTWDADAYVPMPWRNSHVLALKYDGGVSGGDNPRTFRLGGFPEQDIIQDLLNESGLFGGYIRGYPTGAFEGNVFHQMMAEYRFPIWDIFEGVGTLPFWARRLTGAVYSDMALSWFDSLDFEQDFHATVGAELNVTMTLFYELPLTFRMGYARAVTEPPSEQLYLIMGSNL